MFRGSRSMFSPEIQSHRPLATLPAGSVALAISLMSRKTLIVLGAIGLGQIQSWNWRLLTGQQGED